ncbi:hypothetical protein F5144DRAFT_569259 [Chaetomium tenue]|uniref:Uncharacterized protein n=1 Tax=Chaetomium tenue TaxID=1854479 RepID=A0ACB7PCP4_9PEZI|nr:hypothetical protein F5144DRAFT_569259 [Chaetomium globosum]
MVHGMDGWMDDTPWEWGLVLVRRGEKLWAGFVGCLPLSLLFGIIIGFPGLDSALHICYTPFSIVYFLWWSRLEPEFRQAVRQEWGSLLCIVAH